MARLWSLAVLGSVLAVQAVRPAVSSVEPWEADENLNLTPEELKEGQNTELLAGTEMKTKEDNSSNSSRQVIENLTTGSSPGVVLAPDYTTGYGTQVLKFTDHGQLQRQGKHKDPNPDDLRRNTLHVDELDDIDVRHASSVALRALWYKLEKEKHARPYTVEFDRDTSPSVAGWIIAVAGVVPLAIGCLVTCCALPRFLLSVCYKTAFDEEGQGDKEQEKKEKKDHEEQEKDKEENEDKKQAPHIEEKVSFFPKPSEPVPRLKESLLSMILNHWVTRYSLVGFFVSYTVATQINSVDLMSSNTYPSLLIDMVEGLLLCLLCCNVVFGQQAVFGKEAAEGNEILKLGAKCPQGLKEQLQKDLRMLLVPAAPTLILAFATTCICLVAPPLMIVIYRKWHPDKLWEVFLKLLFGGGLKHIVNFCLLHVSFLYFVLSSFIVARIAEEHVKRVELGVAKMKEHFEPLSKKVNKEWTEKQSRAATKAKEAAVQDAEETKKEEQKVEQAKAALKDSAKVAVQEAHHECVILAFDTLPALEKTGKPILGFAVLNVTYSFVWMFNCIVMNEAFSYNRLIAVLTVTLVLTVNFPLGVLCLLAPAVVSDACDRLLDNLNKLRSLDVVDEDEVKKTETFIKQFNRGEGLGFLVYRICINKRLIIEVVIKAVAFSSVILTSAKKFLTLQDEMRKSLEAGDAMMQS